MTPPEIPSTGYVRTRAFGVHLFTALGAGIALLALLEAVREHWAAMFAWLGVALLIDGIDGPLARRLDVASALPEWSGPTLDLVVDFTTYVFLPAYAIVASGLLLPVGAPVIGIAIVMSGAIYFSDQRMKTDDNHFRGFPALWNAAAFYLFLLKPGPWIATLAMAALVAMTFAPFNVMHPLRVARLRGLTIGLVALASVLAIVTVFHDFQVGPGIKATLCAIGLYVLFSDAVIRRMQRVTR